MISTPADILGVEFLIPGFITLAGAVVIALAISPNTKDVASTLPMCMLSLGSMGMTINLVFLIPILIAWAFNTMTSNALAKTIMETTQSAATGVRDSAGIAADLGKVPFRVLTDQGNLTTNEGITDAVSEGGWLKSKLINKRDKRKATELKKMEAQKAEIKAEGKKWNERFKKGVNKDLRMKRLGSNDRPRLSGNNIIYGSGATQGNERSRNRNIVPRVLKPNKIYYPPFNNWDELIKKEEKAIPFDLVDGIFKQRKGKKKKR